MIRPSENDIGRLVVHDEKSGTITGFNDRYVSVAFGNWIKSVKREDLEWMTPEFAARERYQPGKIALLRCPYPEGSDEERLFLKEWARLDG